MEDDIKILKVEYLSCIWLDLTQIFTNASNEDNLHWKIQDAIMYYHFKDDSTLVLNFLFFYLLMSNGRPVKIFTDPGSFKLKIQNKQHISEQLYFL